MIKSRERSSHGHAEIGRGHKSPGGRWWSNLICWQVIQLVMSRWTSCFIDAHMKFSRMWANVFIIPIWPPVGVEWNSARIVGSNRSPCGSQIRSRCNIRPSRMTHSGWFSGSSWTYFLLVMNSSLEASSILSSCKKTQLGMVSTKIWPCRGSGRFCGGLGRLCGGSGRREKAFAAKLCLSAR